MSKKYILNEEFIPELLEHQKKVKEFYATFDTIEDVPKNLRCGVFLMSNKLVKMIQLLVVNISRKPKFYKKRYMMEDIISEVTIFAMKLALKFDIEYAIREGKSPNAYGYFTFCIERAIVSFCDKENERNSKHLDFIIEEARSMLEKTFGEDRVIIKKAVTPIVEMRNDVVGKYSVDNMKNLRRKKVS